MVRNNIAIQQGDYKVEYVKTAGGSVLRKKEYQGSELTKSYRYLAGGAVLQTCSLTNDNDCATTDIYIGLPGGLTLTLTLSPNNPDTTKRAVYSIKNFHGDTAITAAADGTPTSSVYLYEPFGMAAPSSTFGTNSNPTNATDESMGWAANPTRKVAGAFTIPIIQMGARVYLPTAGRFLQVDPVEGGTLNAYVYAHDPVNMEDYSGLFLVRGIELLRQAVTRATPYIQKAINNVKSTPKTAPIVPTATELAKRAEQARKLASENKLTYTETAARHLSGRPYMNSNLLIQEIMKTKPMADPQGAAGTVMWRAFGTNWNIQGKAPYWSLTEPQVGFYELLAHPESGKIYHFLFKPLK